MRVKLTDKTIATATVPPGKSELLLWDSEVTGLALRVYASGRRIYSIQYRNAHRRTRKLKLGPHGVLTLAQARRSAREVLGAVWRGEDPASEKQCAREAPTFADLAERYLRDYAEPKKRTAREDRRQVEKVLLPRFGRMKLEALTSGDVERLHASLHATPFAANRVLALLSTMMRLAERWEMRSRHSNPVLGIKRYPEPPRRRYLAEQEIARLGGALLALERESAECRPFCDATRLLVLTGARRGEILRLDWAEVDLDGARLELPPERTKENRRKAIHLVPAAVAILARQSRGEERVFPDLTVGRFVAGWHTLLKRAELTDVRPHDLRHTFASTGVAAGLSLPVLGALLGHTKPETTQRYAHLSDDPLRKAAEAIGGRLTSALEGRTLAEVHRLGGA